MYNIMINDTILSSYRLLCRLSTFVVVTCSYRQMTIEFMFRALELRT